MNPPANTPRITPYLLYEDVGGAIDFLGKAFGFKESMRLPGPGGKIAHAEMRLADGMIMLGCPSPDYKNPKHLGQATQNLYVYVDDVDAHYDRARKSNAKILQEPTTEFYGDRRYGAVDPEGHCWYFAQHVRDVSPEEMAASAPKG
jgi:PhnB protein